jgi:glycosyltransferase involved in cell wall biosynthesis
MEHSELSRFRIERIHNGVDLQRFSRQPGLRRDLGISDDAQVLLFAAHHAGWTADERKGGHVLARALAEIVIPRYPDVIVLAVGGGMVPNLPNVRPLGFIKPEDIARYYSTADIFVAPSLADNLPYTVLEAMGCGIPVVASRVGGIPEEIDDGRTGRLFSVGSAEELGSTLLDLLANPQLCRDMGAAGRKRAEEMFGMEVFVRQHEDLYQSVVASPGASSNAR